MTLNVTINGEPADIDARTVLALLEERGVDPEARGVAVARNGAVIRRADWSETALADGDALEIVKPFSGG
ncbi:MAG: sulfur carrier protein ThiS [Rhodovibrionaceae bacterium]|nr:sulfur carrier protein ThiS [Rhodovibrionaceae bacterium]